jgi:peptide/nickel transport system ATP-binding protein
MTDHSVTVPPLPADAPLLRVAGLTTSFAGRHLRTRIIDDIRFDVGPRRVLGIVGESGSGKSVTVRSILGLLRHPGRVDAGQVILKGRDLIGLSEPEMRAVRGNDIAMVFQDPQAALNPVMTIGEQIVEAMIVHGVSRADATARALDLLRQIGIPDAERNFSRYPHQFSGGMRQRVVIAMALANRPALLIADEPTTALDVTIQAQILRLLRGLKDDLGVSIILITHDMGVVAELCDDLVVMYGGRVVERGTVAEVFRAPRHPYTAALLHSVPRIGAEVGRLRAIPGTPPTATRMPPGCAFHPRCALAIDVCRVDVPQTETVAPGHSVACWVGPAPPAAPADETRSRPTRAPAGADPILRLEDLRTDVSGGGGTLFRKAVPVYAVDGVSLEVRPGETLGLVGESGCGKSTLSRTVVGINAIAGGKLVVAGRDVTAMAPDDRRMVARTIQYVFQDPFASLNPRRSIAQSLAEALEIAGVGAAETRARSTALLRRVGLTEDFLDRYPYELSGGQRQRIGIARALATEPKLLICDEPVSALDVSIQAQIINLLEDLRDELGLGYLFIAHDLSVVRHISDNVAVMYLGRIVEYGTTAQVYGNPQHPYTKALISSTPEPVPGAATKTVVLTGDMPSMADPPSGCRFRTRCPVGPTVLPEREICRTRSPDLQETVAGQKAACHFAGASAPRANAS